MFNNNSLFPNLQSINVQDTREASCVPGVSCVPGELAAITRYDRESCVPGGPAGNTREGPAGGAPVREGPPAGVSLDSSPCVLGPGRGKSARFEPGVAANCGSLGSTYKIARGNRILRFVLQQAAGEILPDERVAWCNKRVIPDREFVGISYSESTEKAHYKNIMRCCQVWICPVCSQKVIFERKSEIKTGVANYKAAGGFAYMVTFTLQHSRGDPLKKVLEDLLVSTQKLFSSTWWIEKKQDLQLQGRISALEARWGENGWHPHKHLLFLCKKSLDPFEQLKFTQELTKRYCLELARRGAYANPDIGVVFTEDKDDGGYLAKWGIDAEMTQGPMKPGRPGSKTPFDLLLWWLLGAGEPAMLYKEYWKNFKWHRQLVFHKGTRKLLGLLPANCSDQAVLDKSQADDVLLYQVGLDLWKKICKMRLRGQLLDVAENGGVVGVEAYLRGLYDD